MVRSGNSNRIGILGKYYLNTGQLIYFKEFTIGTFFRMAAFPSTTSPTSIYLCGATALAGQTTSKASVFRIIPSTGALDLTFNSSGFKQYLATNTNLETKFRDITSDGASGFVVVGSIRNDNPPNTQPERDAFIVRIQSNGTEVWRKVIAESTLSGYTDLNQATETPFCTGSPAPPTTETGNEEAWSVERMPDNNFAVLMRFDWIELGTGGMPPPAPSQPNGNGCWQPTQLSGTDGCWPFNTEQYYDNDLALVKLRFSDGLPLYSLDAGRSVAVDNWAHMVVSGWNIYLLASKFFPDNNNTFYNEEIWGSVIKIEDQPFNNPARFLSRWRKDAETQLSFEFCPFGICRRDCAGRQQCLQRRRLRNHQMGK